ncbi:MAG: type II toxin-antitoxin system VapB family antitoxin [Actinobacteria bacterium]|nr:type II toxin-antitoxin system VapB family antitoxin [Actinomycetota bacterium]
MALNVKNPEADHLARALARATGETITDAVIISLRERLARETRRQSREMRMTKLGAIMRRGRDLPVLDERTGDEILFDDRGLPG